MFGKLLTRVRGAIGRALGLHNLEVDLTHEQFAYFWPGAVQGWDAGRGMPKAMINSLLTMDMPGESYQGPILLTSEEITLRHRLQEHVHKLATEIGMRNTRYPKALDEAASYVDSQLRSLRLETEHQDYRTSDGHRVRNIEAVMVGRDSKVSLVIGAHYDTVDCPGADDNASGVASLLEIARGITDREKIPRQSIRFVAFANEEPPYFYSDDMGSRVYANHLKASGERLLGMICLESLGYFSDDPGSQFIPPALAPYFDHNRGDFIGFFSDNASRDFLKQFVGRFREHAEVPSQGLAASSLVQGIDFSDHESFQRLGYDALMVCDTAFMRNKHYHTEEDTPDKLDWTRFTKVTEGLTKAIMDLVA